MISGILAVDDANFIVGQRSVERSFIGFAKFFLAFMAYKVGQTIIFFWVSGLSGWYARAKGGRQTQPTTD
tara:strand:- start:380 stop:589 length:210 start_codon:yes stop_codon:yes gene_type:complete